MEEEGTGCSEKLTDEPGGDQGGEEGVEELMLSNCGSGEDLRISWPESRCSQSDLREINPEYSLEGLIL